MTRTIQTILLFLLLIAASTAQAVRITPAHSGSWYDPSYDKQGFTIEVLGRAGDGAERIVAVQWNTYDDDGSPAWAIGVGVTERNVVSMTMQRAFGGARPPLQVQASDMQDWAEMTFTFGTCHTAVADFSMIDSDEEGSYALRRLTQIGATTCTGGLGDEVEPGFAPLTLVRQLVPTAAYPTTQGQVKFFLRPAVSGLEIDVRKLPAGTYSIRIADLVEGSIEASPVGAGQGGMTMGQMRFASPAGDNAELLDFDPRGQLIEIVDGEGAVALSVTLPEQADPESGEG